MEMGRGTDTVLGHLSLGEIVIPRAIQDDPEVQQMLAMIFEKAGADIREFTVGDEMNKINPETGHPEFFFKSLKKIFKKVAPIAAIAAPIAFPGIGAAIGGGLLGAGAAGSATLGSALLGGGLSALGGGGLKGALTGGALGALGANIGSLAGGAAQGPSQIGQIRPTGYGSGILGGISKATGLTSTALPSLGGLVSGGGGGSSFSLGGGLASALGGYAQNDAIKKAQEAQLRAQQQQLANIGTFDPSNITSDAGYQFNLEQGQQGLNRALGAQGNLFSGAALKAASRYNQDYANNALNSAYQRYLDKINAQNAIYGQGGDVRASSGLAKAENIAKTASGILNPQPSLEDLLRLYRRA